MVEVFFTRTKLQTIVDTAALKGAAELGVDLSTATTERTKAFANNLADPCACAGPSPRPPCLTPKPLQ